MSQSAVTDQQRQIAGPTSGNATAPQFNPVFSQNTPVNRPAKKSKAWVWVLGIVGILLVFGGLAFVGVLALVVSNVEDQPTVVKDKTPLPGRDEPPARTGSTNTEDFLLWEKGTNEFGSSELENGQYTVSSKAKDYYYALVSPDNDFKTYNATTKATVRNVNGTQSQLGYGLIIHSDTSKALAKDYAFLIDSAKQTYRVAQHTDSEETSLVGWTRFPAIRSGTQTNEIEIRDQNGKMSLFINGQFATSVEDTVKYKDGVVGIYVGDGIPIAFSNLTVTK